MIIIVLFILGIKCCTEGRWCMIFAPVYVNYNNFNSNYLSPFYFWGYEPPLLFVDCRRFAYWNWRGWNDKLECGAVSWGLRQWRHGQSCCLLIGKSIAVQRDRGFPVWESWGKTTFKQLISLSVCRLSIFFAIFSLSPFPTTLRHRKSSCILSLKLLQSRLPT